MWLWVLSNLSRSLDLLGAITKGTSRYDNGWYKIKSFKQPLLLRDGIVEGPLVWCRPLSKGTFFYTTLLSIFHSGINLSLDSSNKKHTRPLSSRDIENYFQSQFLHANIFAKLAKLMLLTCLVKFFLYF